MAAQFSPGPWRQELPAPGYRFSQLGDRIIIAANGLVVAMVLQDAPPIAGPNAYMMAAAPELYEALKRIVTDEIRCTIASHHKSDCSCAYCLAIAALAKAEGSR